MQKRNPTLFDQPDGTTGESGQDVMPDELLGSHLVREMIHFLEKKFGTITKSEKLAVALSIRFRNAGHVCLPVSRSVKELGHLLDLESSLIRLLPDKPLDLPETTIIGRPGSNAPFILNEGNLYQHRYFKLEQELKEWIKSKSESISGALTRQHIDQLDILFTDEPSGNDSETNWQKVAALLSVVKPLLIVSGGPGTGKTTTVARLLALNYRTSGKKPKIALAAPTGKAAGRMGEALKEGFKRLELSDEELADFPGEAQTIHRLLRDVEDRGLLPPVRKKLLPHDIIIVDEASMIDLSLMSRLVNHIKPDAKLILLGDKNQLASVEAGSVFADLCGKTGNYFRDETLSVLRKAGMKITHDDDVSDISSSDDSIVYLTKSYRFSKESGIGALSELVKNGIDRPEAFESVSEGSNEIMHQEFSYGKKDFESLLSSITGRVGEAAGIEDREEMLDFWKREIWLTVIRRGIAGADRLNKLTEQTLATKRAVRMTREWYHGRPVIVTRNDYDLGVYNGDFGVCMRTPNSDQMILHIQSGTDIKSIRPERLQNFSPAFFLTVHKSQGSEFDKVNLLLPPEDVPILSKELLYTAITRAKETFSLYGRRDLFVRGANRKTERFTGF